MLQGVRYWHMNKENENPKSGSYGKNERKLNTCKTSDENPLVDLDLEEDQELGWGSNSEGAWENWKLLTENKRSSGIEKGLKRMSNTVAPVIMLMLTQDCEKKNHSSSSYLGLRVQFESM